MTPQPYTSSVFSNVHFVHFVSDLYLKIYSYFCTLYFSFNCLRYQLFISLIVSYNIFSSMYRRHALLYLYPASVINKCVFWYHRVCNTTDSPSGAGIGYLSGAHEFIPVFSGFRITLFLIPCVCFVDRLRDSNYPIGIFKLILQRCTVYMKSYMLSNKAMLLLK